MATTNNQQCSQVDGLINSIKIQNSTLRDLARLIEITEIGTLRRDRLTSLDALRCRIEDEIHGLNIHESSAACSRAKADLVGGVAGLIGGAMAASMKGAKNPVNNGLRISRQMLERKAPSGVIMISARGEPLEFQAISISQIARDSTRVEADVIVALKAKGYFLFAVEEFYQLIRGLKDELLNESAPLALEIGEHIRRRAVKLMLGNRAMLLQGLSVDVPTK
ncbi:MAG: hypothetical protein P3T54_01575 [Dehalogenimonas sp.]|uniref:Uncharacterized protein n=1 Tax=Candidatus Dehalogenimonas loeffleri TaxID=3127115 RepID=A0ABZ2J976_9CHLR|nr:hypothetical protein [Dehalogenimonas sp.]